LVMQGVDGALPDAEFGAGFAHVFRNRMALM
jgi:hypothetical protein